MPAAAKMKTRTQPLRPWISRRRAAAILAIPQCRVARVAAAAGIPTRLLPGCSAVEFELSAIVTLAEKFAVTPTR
jgi:hypothetical protein